MAKIKIIDVATLAGVSKSTVSQYLNGRFGHMSAQTKERIRLAVEELNYVPNPIARSLKSDKTKTIGVIVRDISGFNTSRILRGIDDFCKRNDYNVLIYNTDFNEVIERKFQLEYQDCNSDIVLSDYRGAAQKATEYLLKLGHRRIAFLTQYFEDNLSRTERYQGYLDALRIYGVDHDESLIQYWQRDTGFQQSPATLLKIKNAPTAFFTQHLAITTDLLKELDEQKIEIPKQVSVLGFDEIPMVEMFKVPITVVQQDPYQLGEESAKLLLGKLLSPDSSVEIKKIIVPCALVIRSSCQSIN